MQGNGKRDTAVIYITFNLVLIKITEYKGKYMLTSNTVFRAYKWVGTFEEKNVRGLDICKYERRCTATVVDCVKKGCVSEFV